VKVLCGMPETRASQACYAAPQPSLTVHFTDRAWDSQHETDGVAGRLTLFATVVEAGGFTEAGRRIGLTASSVARRMDNLEASLGARLLTRTTRHITLTEAGAAFHERASRIAADLAEARALVAGLDAEPRGTLRIDVPVAFGRLHVAPLLGELLAHHPALHVDLSLTDRHIDLAEEGVDVAVRLGLLPDSGLVAAKLAPLRRVACASPSYLDRRGCPAAPADLAGHDCLVMQHCTGAARSWYFMEDGKLRPAAVGSRMRVNNAEVLVGAAVRGLGIAHLPTWLVHKEIASGELVPVLEGFEAPEAEQGASTPSGPRRTPRLPRCRLSIGVEN